MKKILYLPFLVLILFYRYFISPLFPKTCRFAPSCSEYAIDAFKTHLPHKALCLTIKRILRCHPWGAYKFDPVPPRKKE